MWPLKKWVIVSVCVAGVGGVAGLAVWWFVPGATSWLRAELATELAPSDPRYRNVMCGPTSLSIALGRLGVSVPRAEIASGCRVTSYGVALKDLERAAASHHAVSAAVKKRLSWDDLRALDGTAVLSVNGDHYIAADPREVSSGTAHAVAIRGYDGEAPARWYSRAALEKIWSGDALVLTKKLAHAGARDNASIAWNECYLDQGILAGTAVTNFKFSFRNDGGKELHIKGVRASCGCVKHKLSAERLAPGESAQIDFGVALGLREGYIQQYAIIETNDPENPVSYLRMVCGVPRERRTSIEAIHLGDLPQGGSASQSFVVADPGFTGIKVRNAEFRLRGGSRSTQDISCEIIPEMIRGNAGKVGADLGFSAIPGDYLVRLVFNAGNACPSGPFEGEVIVTVESEASAVALKVDISGMVVQDVHPVPRVALVAIGGLDPESVGTAAIQLRSRANRTITVVKCWSESKRPLEIGVRRGSETSGDEYVITARAPDLAVGAPPSEATAFFELDDGAVVSLSSGPRRKREGRLGQQPSGFRVSGAYRMIDNLGRISETFFDAAGRPVITMRDGDAMCD